MKKCRLLFILVLSISYGYADPTPFAVGGFTITQEVVLPVSPEAAFDMMTGDISGWWDHHFAENPKALYVEPKPGGGFYEIFDDKGNGAKHATVILADRGKKLRYDGPLGLSGRAINDIVTYDYEKVEGGTKVTVTVNMSGQIDAYLAKRVEGVWHHFLVEQLKPYAEKMKK